MALCSASLQRTAAPACCSARRRGAAADVGACSRPAGGPLQQRRQRVACGGSSGGGGSSSSLWLASSPLRQQQSPQQQRLAPARASGGGDADLDPIERLVGRLFGRAALEDPTPGGLKRLSDEAAKELYPATTDQWAEPLPGDGPDMAVLRPLLAQTQLESAPLRLAYDADSDGWTPDAFHAVDGFGATLVVAETAGGALVGGYSPRGWISLGEDRDAIAAFLFTWRDGDLSRRPVKLPKVGGAALAVVRDAPGCGVFFAPDGLHIPLAPGAERSARCKLGPYYARMPGGGKSLFAEAEGGKAQLVGLRAYVAEGSGEEWELDGIVWKTKRKS